MDRTWIKWISCMKIGTRTSYRAIFEHPHKLSWNHSPLFKLQKRNILILNFLGLMATKRHSILIFNLSQELACPRLFSSLIREGAETEERLPKGGKDFLIFAHCLALSLSDSLHSPYSRAFSDCDSTVVEQGTLLWCRDPSTDEKRDMMDHLWRISTRLYLTVPMPDHFDAPHYLLWNRPGFQQGFEIRPIVSLPRVNS